MHLRNDRWWVWPCPAYPGETSMETCRSFVRAAILGEYPIAARLTFSKTAGGFGCFIFQCGTLQRSLISRKFFFICPLKIRPVENNSRWKCKRQRHPKSIDVSLFLGPFILLTTMKKQPAFSWRDIMSLILVSHWLCLSVASLSLVKLVWIYNYRSEIKNQDLYFLIVLRSTEDYFEVSLKLSVFKNE